MAKNQLPKTLGSKAMSVIERCFNAILSFAFSWQREGFLPLWRLPRVWQLACSTGSYRGDRWECPQIRKCGFFRAGFLILSVWATALPLKVSVY